jgi:hypothetical protein
MHDSGRIAAVGLFVVMCSALVAAQAGVMVLPGQARDPQAPGTAAPADVGTGVIAGQVTMAGSGQPVEGARVTVSGAGLRGSRSALSDIDGQFAFVDLPEGAFTLRATLTGYLSGTYGQKRTGGSGTPIALVEGQQFTSASVEITRGGVIAGAVFDERRCARCDGACRADNVCCPTPAVPPPTTAASTASLDSRLATTLSPRSRAIRHRPW